MAGYGYQRIADTMGIGLATAHGLVMEAIAGIPAEQAEELRRLLLDQCAEMMQRLMPQLEDGPPTAELIDGILNVQGRILQLHGITGRIGGHGDDAGDGADSEAILIARIKADAPVLRPGGPVPANPIL